MDNIQNNDYQILADLLNSANTTAELNGHWGTAGRLHYMGKMADNEFVDLFDLYLDATLRIKEETKP